MSVYIRPLQESDALISYKWRNDPAVWKFTGNRPNREVTLEIETEWIKTVLQRKNEKRFAICISDTDEYIGNVQLINITSYDAEFHIFIGEKKYWSGGYGTSATKLLIELAFNELNVQCVYLSVKKDNIGAIKAYERAGFYQLVELGDGFVKMATYAIDKNPKKLSVFMITYNHKEYIAQALDSILMQEVDFDYEIVVGEDCSTDNTRNILLNYQKQHPAKFKLLLPSENIGANKNQIQTLKACKGNYIAMLEGDDYWTDPFKLQKQVNFLESNKQFVSCFHPVSYYYENTNEFRDGRRILGDKVDFTFNNILSSWVINTCSVVFRNIIKEYPPFFYNIAGGDLFLCLMLAAKGNFYYLNEEMAVYRINSNSVTPAYEAYKAKNKKAELLRFESDLLSLNDFTLNEFDQVIKRKIQSERIFFKLEEAKNAPEKLFYLIKYIIKFPSFDQRVIKNLVNKYYPQVYQFYPFKRIKNF